MALQFGGDGEDVGTDSGGSAGRDKGAYVWRHLIRKGAKGSGNALLLPVVFQWPQQFVSVIKSLDNGLSG
jgi:hypothetical protein